MPSGKFFQTNNIIGTYVSLTMLTHYSIASWLLFSNAKLIVHDNDFIPDFREENK